MKKGTIALVLILAVMLVAGIACSRDGNVEPTPTLTPTSEAILSTPESTVRSLFSAINNDDCYGHASCCLPKYYDELTSEASCEILKTITVYNLQTSLVSISDDSAVVRSEYDAHWSDGTSRHIIEIADLERIGTKWLIALTTEVD